MWIYTGLGCSARQGKPRISGQPSPLRNSCGTGSLLLHHVPGGATALYGEWERSDQKVVRLLGAAGSDGLSHAETDAELQRRFAEDSAGSAEASVAGLVLVTSDTLIGLGAGRSCSS